MNIYPKITFGVLITLCLFTLLSACNKIEEAANFDMLIDSPERRVVADSALYELADSEVLLLEQNITISLDSIERKFDIKKVENAKFDYIRIEAETPAGSKLNWISRLRATVSSTDIQEMEVGTYDGSKPDAPIIDLTLNDAPLTPFIAEETFKLKIYGRISPPLPASSTSIIINSRIRLTVQPV